MSVLPTSRRLSARSSRARRVAALHRQGERWRLVVVEAAQGGTRTRLVEAMTVPFGETSAVKSALQRTRADRLVRVAPPGRTVSKLVEVPEGAEAEVLGALELLAEAQLPESIAAHRRGWGLLNAAAAPGSRAGLLVGWAGEADEPPVHPEGESGECPETWTSEIVALASLVGGIGASSPAAGRDGEAVSIALYADRAAGSISLAATNGSRSTVRTLRENGGSAEEWFSAVKGAMAETRERLGVEPEPGQVPVPDGSSAQVLLVDAPARTRLARACEGLKAEAAWLAEYGVALGAAAGCLTAGALARPLFEMAAQPPRERLQLVDRLVKWLAHPARAWSVVACAAVLALLIPLGTAWLRESILTAKVEEVERQLGVQGEQDLARRAALYKDLARRRWPMTKLLADVAGCLPVGAVLESVQFDAGQKFIIRGRAEKLDVVTGFKQTLEGTGVFAGVSIDRTQTGSASEAGSNLVVQFDLSGTVARPLDLAKGVDDFTENTLVKRLYGDAVPGTEGGGSGGARTAGSTGSGTEVGRRDVFDRGGRDAQANAPVPIPDPLTDEQIAQLDNVSAMKEATARDRARRRTDIDDATRDRLKAESDKLRERARAARAGGAGASGAQGSSGTGGGGGS